VRREALGERFEVAIPDGVSERYNVAPAQRVLGIRRGESGARVASLLRWGLIPHWAKDARIAYKISTPEPRRSLRKAPTEA
jgi:putative SOS response-associated peptidase YedK